MDMQPPKAHSTSAPGIASINDVARVARTSIATVSRLINGYTNIRPNTAQRIRDAIAELNYCPNARGRALRSGRRQTIGVLHAPITDVPHDELYLNTMTNSLTRAITAEGYRVQVEFMDKQGDRLVVPHVVAANEVDGLIIIAHLEQDELAQVAAWNLPVCLIANTFDHPRFVSVHVDNYGGSCEVVRYLAALGRRKIKFVHGNLHWPATVARHKGFVDAMAEIGQQLGPEDVVQVPQEQQNYQGGYNATRQILKQDAATDAVFYVNDLYATGGLAGALSMGLRVPVDVNIVGYDDSWLAAQLVPPLTTVSTEQTHVCRAAAQAVVRAVEKPKQAQQEIVIHSRMIVRESTAVFAETTRGDLDSSDSM